jgi:hypothetical protein
MTVFDLELDLDLDSNNKIFRFGYTSHFNTNEEMRHQISVDDL